MFASFSRGWRLTKSSFQVLRLDKEILMLPVLSGIVTILATLTLFGVGILSGMPQLAADLAAQGEGQAATTLWAVMLFAYYLVSYAIVVFFNSAVVECATIRFNGGDPVLKDGLSKAWSRKGRILQWAALAATVGVILKLLEAAARQSRNDFARMAGQIGVWIAGAAWNLAVYFVVPVLVHKDLGPVDALKESARTWKRVWGETFASGLSSTFIFLIAGLVGLLPLFAGMNLLSAGATLVGAGLVMLTLGYWALLGVAASAVNTIIVAALYKYATDGELPSAFSDAELPPPSGGAVQRIPYA